MSKTTTTSELKNKTKKIINYLIENPNQNVLITTYNKPKVIMVSYDRWLTLNDNNKQKPTLLDRVKNKIVKDVKFAEGDSTLFVRKMRDEE